MDAPFAPDTARHNEWLIDEAIKETFPASDPISPGQPGSLVGLRYAEFESPIGHRRSGPPGVRWRPWLVTGGVLCFAIWLAVRRRRRL
jgi:hypothetical protein